MKSGIAEQIATMLSAANVVVDFAVDLAGTTGAILVLVSFSAAPTAVGTMTVRDENNEPLCDFASIFTKNCLIALVGDIEGAPTLLRFQTNNLALDPGHPSRLYRGGSGSRRPSQLNINVGAPGAGITTTVSVVAERT